MDQLTCWVALSLASQPVDTRGLLARWGGVERALRRLLDGGRVRWRVGRGCSLEDLGHAAGQVLERCAASGVRALAFDGEEYPPALRWIDRPPPVLYAVGPRSPRGRPCVSVVGSRRCTDGGRWAARSLARGLSRAGVCVVSGMAFGVDAAAHEGAMSGPGGTVAVLAGGPERASPSSLRQLHERLVAHQLVISEMPPGTSPRAGYFPRRNRLVAGMARATVVVEAAEHSGALITANLARQEGRLVFAVPGPVDAVGSIGTNGALRRGRARVAVGAGDVLDALGLARAAPAEATAGGGDTTAALVLSVLRGGAASLEVLAERARMAQEAVAAVLLQLRLQGTVAALPDGRYYLAEE